MKRPKVGLKRSPFPLHLTVDGLEIANGYLLKFLRSLDENGDVVIDGWKFLPLYGRALLKDSRKAWLNYLTPEPLGVVVSVGAGCGEDVKFFKAHGAAEVIAIERDEGCLPYLEANSKKFGFKYVLAPFDPEFLMGLIFNTLKLDIEGWELLLLPYLDRLKHVNIVLESHCGYITEQFIAKGFKTRKVDRWGVGYIYRWREGLVEE